jgi:hypothetical protein
MVKPLQPFGVVEPMNFIGVLALPRPPGLTHLVHQPLAFGVLALGELKGVSRGAQPRWQADRGRHGHCAVVALERNFRPAKARRHEVALDRRLERVAMGGNAPAEIVGGLDELGRHRARDPQLHRLMVDSVGAAQDFCGRIGGVAVGADRFQRQSAPRFIIAMQNMPIGAIDLLLNSVDIYNCSGAQRQRLMHRHSPCLQQLGALCR